MLIHALFGLVGRRVPSEGNGGTRITLKPFLKRRRRFVGETLLPVKHPGSYHSSHNRWSTPSSPDSGEYINKTKYNKEKRGLPGAAGRDTGQD